MDNIDPPPGFPYTKKYFCLIWTLWRCNSVTYGICNGVFGVYGSWLSLCHHLVVVYLVEGALLHERRRHLLCADFGRTKIDWRVMTTLVIGYPHDGWGLKEEVWNQLMKDG